MYTPVSPESSAVHIIEAQPEVIAEQPIAIPPMPVAEGVFYSADNYFDTNSGFSHYVNDRGETVIPPREVLTSNNELRMISWILEHRGIIPPEYAVQSEFIVELPDQPED